MKRIKVITAIITVITMFIVMPFSVVEARSTSTAQTGTFDHGEWKTIISLGSSSSDYLDMSIYGIVDNSSFTACSIIEINLDNYYSGNLTVNFANTISGYTLYWVEGTGIQSYTKADKYIDINIDSTNHIMIYLFSSTYNNAKGQPSGISVASSFHESDLLTYNIEYERMSAYVFFRALGSDIIYDSNYPAPYIELEDNKTVRYWMYAGRTYYLSFLTTAATSYADMFQYFTITPPSGGTLTPVRLTQNYITATGGYKLVSWSITVDKTGTYTWDWTYDLVNIIPLYWNYSDAPISEYLAYISGIPYHSAEYDTLQDILNSLGSSSDSTVDSDINTQADTLTDLHDQESQVSDSVNSDFNDFQNNVDLNDYNFIDSISDASSYFKMVLTDVFSETAPVRAFWIVPVLCVVLLALLGG